MAKKHERISLDLNTMGYTFAVYLRIYTRTLYKVLAYKTVYYNK